MEIVYLKENLWKHTETCCVTAANSTYSQFEIALFSWLQCIFYQMRFIPFCANWMIRLIHFWLGNWLNIVRNWSHTPWENWLGIDFICRNFFNTRKWQKYTYIWQKISFWSRNFHASFYNKISWVLLLKNVKYFLPSTIRTKSFAHLKIAIIWPQQ